MLTLMCQFCYASLDMIPYVSPGFKVGVGRNHRLTFSPKISIGVHNADVVFANLTYGRTFSRSSTAAPLQNGYRFLEIEGGSAIASRIVVGGGAGLVFPLEDDVKVLPKFSLFAGAFLFLRSDHVFCTKYKEPLLTDVGAMLVAPVSPMLLMWD